MQHQILQHTNGEEQLNTAPSAFIEANTIAISQKEINEQHIIPVFAKDNEPAISQNDFIQTALDAAKMVFDGHQIGTPQIRVSHPIKGRIPEARHKAAKDLLDDERTLYYERMAFIVEVPGIHGDVAGNRLSMTLGGIKAYNQDNLGSKKGSAEHFHLFIGFQNKVCCNLCISTDGLATMLRASSLDELFEQAYMLFSSFSEKTILLQLQDWMDYSLTERQFAQFIGRCRMYQYMPTEAKTNITPLTLGDSQINQVVKAYYEDPDFGGSRELTLWNLYNLLTGANKSSYIDRFIGRAVHAGTLIEELHQVLSSNGSSWFLPAID